jgi:hypothetical protein
MSLRQMAFQEGHSIIDTMVTTYAARLAHPERRILTEAGENVVVQWVEKRDSIEFPPKHKKLGVAI